MYKVFIYNKALILTANPDQIPFGDNVKRLTYESPATFREAHRLLDRTNGVHTLVVSHPDLKKLWDNFKSTYRYLKAAGGVVQSPENKWLFIFRRGCWDLPKGKIEKGEKKKEAAIREVEEECGISGLTIVGKLPSSFHIYPQGGRLILKRTYWYQMETAYDGQLEPQLEEEITDVCWLGAEELEKVRANTFPSILELMDQANLG